MPEPMLHMEVLWRFAQSLQPGEQLLLTKLEDGQLEARRVDYPDTLDPKDGDGES